MLRYAQVVDLKQWYLALNPNGSILNAARLARKVRTFVNNGDFDVFHGTTIGSKIDIFMMGYVRRFGKKLLTVHDYVPHKKESFFARVLRRKMISSYGNVLTMSDSQYDEADNDKGRVYTGLFKSRLGVYDYLSCLGIDRSPIVPEKYVLFFGRIDEYKDVNLLCRAYCDSVLPSAGYKLVVAGKGETEVKDYANVVLVNKYIESEELASLIRNCRFVVLPYKTVTQSGALMSAFALAKPVIAPAIGDFNNVIVNGKTGRLYDPGSLMSLANNMELLVSEDVGRYEDNIKSHYGNDSEYGWPCIAEGLRDIYLKL